MISLWVALSLGVLFPDLMERTLEVQRLEMIKKGMSDSDIDNAMSIARKIGVPMGAIVTVIIYLIIGAIGSLVGAALAKKNPNPVFPEQLGN